jgi:hypothetical protein
MKVNRIATSPAAMLSLVQTWLAYRVSLRVSPMLVLLVLTTAASVGSIVTWARASQSPGVRANLDLDPSDTKSLADFLASLCAQSYRAAFQAEAPFLSGNALAMSNMMTGMAITPSGDTDRDFVHMMVPHHRGAIDMAVLEIRYGKNSILKRLAQEVIVDQLQEITAMYLAIHESLPASVPAPTWNVASVPPSSTVARTGRDRDLHLNR